MSWTIAVILGLVLGLIYGLSARGSRRGLSWLYAVVGIIGALLGVWIFGILLGITGVTASANFWYSVLWSVVGIVVLVAILDLIVAASIGSSIPLEDRRRTGETYAHEYDDERMRRRRDEDEDLRRRRHDDDMRR